MAHRLAKKEPFRELIYRPETHVIRASLVCYDDYGNGGSDNVKSPELNPQFVTDENGQRVAVILSIEVFEEISDLLDDLADASEIERRRAEPSIPHEEAMRLVRDGGDIPD